MSFSPKENAIVIRSTPLTYEEKQKRLANIKKIRNTPLFKKNKIENKENIDNDITPINSCNIEKTPKTVQLIIG